MPLKDRIPFPYQPRLVTPARHAVRQKPRRASVAGAAGAARNAELSLRPRPLVGLGNCGRGRCQDVMEAEAEAEAEWVPTSQPRLRGNWTCRTSY